MKNKLKFSLFFDGEPIRSIDSLKEHFNATDIWEYYNNRMLHKWLDSRGESDYLMKVMNIKDGTPQYVIKELCDIFDIDANEILDAAIKSIEQKEKSLKRNKEGIKYDKVAAKDYDNIISALTDKYSKLTKYEIKNYVKTLSDNFADFIKYDHKRLFDLLWSKAPVGLLFIIGNRNLYGLIVNDIYEKRKSSSYEVKKWIKENFQDSEDSKSKCLVYSHIEKNTKDRVTTKNGCVILTWNDDIIIDANDLYHNALKNKTSEELCLFPACDIEMTFKSKGTFYCFELV